MSQIQSVTEAARTTAVQTQKTAAQDFSSCLNTTATLEDIFQRAAQKYNLPVELLKAVGKAESNFNPNDVSGAGAKGIMQLMPAACEETGVTDPFDPEQSIMGGAQILARNMKKYNGNVTLALAAYNAGSGNVEKYGGVPPFKETQNYVVKVVQFMNEGVTVPDRTVSSSGFSAAAPAPAVAPAATAVTAATAPASLQSTAPVAPVFVGATVETVSENVADAIFSYADYLQFLDLYFERILSATASGQEQEEKEKEQAEQGTAYYDLRSVRMNRSVQNLLDSL